MRDNNDEIFVNEINKNSDTKISGKYTKRKSSKLAIILLILLLCISIGYAYLSSVLNLNGKSTISEMKWDVHFENVVEDFGIVTPTSPVSLTENSTKLTFDTVLSIPGDKYAFTVDIVNDGTIDAMIKDVAIYGLSVENSRFLNYKVTYEDESEILENDLLKAGDRTKIHLIVEYLNVTEELLNKKTQNISLVFDVNYIQADEKAVERP